MLRTEFTDLVGCTVPIQLAGMGSVGSVELAVAVSRAGGSFGVNFLMPFVDRAAVEMAAGKAKLIEFFYGDPDPSLIGAVHSSGALAC
jgi:nitronate monooxygenase